LAFGQFLLAALLGFTNMSEVYHGFVTVSTSEDSVYDLDEVWFTTKIPVVVTGRKRLVVFSTTKSIEEDTCCSPNPLEVFSYSS
jgi:hypothetical protein